MLKFFRTIAILEGISYLLLFALSMPLKYWARIPEPNLYIGYTHGFLFLVYVILAVVYCMETKCRLKRFMVILIASLLPFGTFYIDQKYLRPASGV